jgi:hypothetical protein
MGNANANLRANTRAIVKFKKKNNTTIQQYSNST